MKDHVEESIAVKQRIRNDEKLLTKIGAVITDLKQMYERGGKLLIAGNGGSAGDAQHFAAEITCQYKESRRGRPAIALHTDTSALTAWGNDKSFESFFERQVEALGTSGDMLIVISTSGNSKNLLLATKKAKMLGIKTVGLLGRDGGGLEVEGLCDISIIVPSHETPHIQEAHIMLIHIICEALDTFFVALDSK